MSDLISRQDAINIIGMDKIEPEIPPSLGSTAERDFKIYNHSCNKHIELIKQLPSAQEETFEWCHDCKEYDQEKHCCHRWSQQIRKTIEELEANYPQEIKDELLYWKERAAKWERDYYIKITKLMRDSAKLLEMPSAQPEQRWIPCSERLPRQGQEVICQCRANMIRVLKLDAYGDWYQDAEHCYMSGFVIAWMPLPEPYKGDADD